MVRRFAPYDPVMADKNYPGTGIVVHFDPDLCIHSERCVSGLPAVFRPKDRPWILATAADADAIAATIDTCPSGALRYTRTAAPETSQPPRSAEAPAKPAPVVISVTPNGPNVIVGPVEIRDAEGALIRTAAKVALCRCGASKTKPFCDGSHRSIGFIDDGHATP